MTDAALYFDEKKQVQPRGDIYILTLCGSYNTITQSTLGKNFINNKRILNTYTLLG